MQVKVDKGENTHIQLVVPHQVSVLTKKGEKLDDYQTTIRKSPTLTAPVKKGDVIGQIVISKGDEVKARSGYFSYGTGK